MSYILDAIKKADRDRRRRAESDRLGFSEAATLPKRRKPLWPYLLICALLLNAAIFLSISRGPGTKFPVAPKRKDPPSKTEIVTERFEMGRPVAPLYKESLREKERPALPEERTKKAATEKQRRTAPEDIGKAPQTTEDLKSGGRPPKRRGDDDSKNQANPGKSKNTGRIYARSELPPGIAGELPDLSLSLHYYNPEPAARLVNVRGRTVKEGDELTPGLKLEEITPEGALFSFQGYRFRIGLNQDR